MSSVFASAVSWLVATTLGGPLCTLLCASKTLQRQVFYLHKLPIWWRQKLDVPESFGFLPGQVLALDIPTSDGCNLYAWLVRPLGLCASSDHQSAVDVNLKAAVSLLQDPDSLLVIYFHGNAGTVGQTRRTDAYRMISSGASRRIFVLAFDYRGFGRSTGSPTEEGLIEDALAVIRWATTIGKVPTRRITLLAQSLGTAIATAAVDRLMVEDPSVDFAGVVLCAAFVDAPSVLLSYEIAGFLRLFALVQAVGSFRKGFRKSIVDGWDTKSRVQRLARHSGRLHLVFLAATYDEVVPVEHTRQLFEASLQEVAGTKAIDGSQAMYDLSEMGAGGTMRKYESSGKCIKEVLVKYGGHNGIMKWAPVALEVLKSFDLHVP